ncbi:MAG: MBL fold metallo-hydrolase [Micavibrio sp.]|nr:MBL fold metallo-hydrolase [Micavibrio sp.]
MKTAFTPRPGKTYTPTHDFIPELGTAEEIFPGLYWMRTPLPFELDHVNIWLLKGPDGFSIIDTGFNFEVALQAWERVFANVIGSTKVDNLFITHFHPDHFGLGGWVADRTKLMPQMTAPEYNIAQSLTDPEMQKTLESIYRPYYVAAGLTPDLMDDMLARRFTYQKVVHTIPATFTEVKPGQTVTLGGKEWLVIDGYGHSPQHASLYNAADKIFIAGDMVLPDISPNISFFPDKYFSADPVGVYLETLDRIKRLVPDDVAVLPSHGVPFRGLHKRIDELKYHHERRLEKLRKVVATGPMTAHQAMVGLFSHRILSRASDIFFALGETLAHLVYEEKAGRIRKTTENGVDSYSIPA